MPQETEPQPPPTAAAATTSLAGTGSSHRDLSELLDDLGTSLGLCITIDTDGIAGDLPDEVRVPIRPHTHDRRAVVVHGERASMDVDVKSAAQVIAQIVGRFVSLQDDLAHRVAELRASYRVSSALTGLGDLESTMRIALALMTEVMEVKAGAIRLLDESTNELVLRASVNLSEAYFSKGPIFAFESELDTRALSGEVVYVADLRGDPRVRFPDLVASEGICSYLTTGLMFHGKPVGTIRLYSGELHEFSPFERSLFRAAAQQVAAAIVNARLLEDRRRARAVRRQVTLAGQVQRRMLPRSMPTLKGFDIAGRCLPSLELGGDFFDLIPSGSRLGIAVGDVVGKGVPAALMMASVRASVRAHANDMMRVPDVLSRTNVALHQDTASHEFATLWYGVLDPGARSLTFSAAGHDPPMVFRHPRHQGEDWTMSRLSEGGTVLGIRPDAAFEEGVVQLARGDIVVMYTDGLTDAMAFDGERYGQDRLIEATHQAIRLGPTPTAGLIVNHILWDVRRFVGLNPATDDITLVVLCATE